MIHWPWVSRRAYDEVCRQRDRLERECDTLIDQMVRIKRVSEGMTELTPQKRKPDPVPETVTNLITGFQSGAVQAQMLEQCMRQRQLGVPWSEIERFLRDSLGVE
jgi:hypothetical protein